MIEEKTIYEFGYANRNHVIGSLVICLALLLGAVCAAFAKRHDYFEQRATGAYVCTQGRMLEWEVVRDGVTNIYDGGQKPVYAPSVRYSYGVDGITHMGDCFAVHRVRVPKDWTPVELQIDPSDPEVCNVWYDPSQPEQSVLRVSQRGDLFLTASFPLALFAGACIMALATTHFYFEARRNEKRRRQRLFRTPLTSR